VVNKTKDGKEETLADVFMNMGLKVDEFTLDALDVHVQLTAFMHAFARLSSYIAMIGRQHVPTL